MKEQLLCKGERRREDVRKAALYGLDYVLVDESQLRLEVFFLGKLPPNIKAGNVRMEGGRRIREIQVTVVRTHRQTDPARDEYLEVTVDRAGDFSEYTISMVEMDANGRVTDQPMAGFDVRYASVNFNFKVNCPTDLDCKRVVSCPPAVPVQPEINYLAKDYGSFRQLIFDRLAVTLPDWREQHTADLGVMLMELLAYVGDQLSYYQDAVATEAYLSTARQRISVRRHARLVDYRMHEGCNARAFITLWTGADQLLNLDNLFFTTALDLPDARELDRHVFQAAELEPVKPGSYEVFEPLGAGGSASKTIYAAQNRIEFYTWGDDECCLPAGATSATLAGAGLHLAVGDYLIFEEVTGPGTGDENDADPRHRQAVRLTRVTEGYDMLYGAGPEVGDGSPAALREEKEPSKAAAAQGTPIVEIEWCSEDALTFPLCLSARMPAPECKVKKGISVARGNVLLLDHGARTSETICTVKATSSTSTCACGCEPAEVVTVAEVVTPQLSQTPLTYAQPLTGCGCAAEVLDQNPRQALPSVYVTAVPQGAADDGTGPRWTPVLDLLESQTLPESQAGDRHFVVEIDNAGLAHLRFGNGQTGAMPEAGTALTAWYRIGNGAAGNVGAEKISCLVYRSEDSGGAAIIPRNPLAARGGVGPESIDEVKQFAPGAFRRTLERAITPNDYAALATDNARRLNERLSSSSGAVATSSVNLPRQKEEEEPGPELPQLTAVCLTSFRRLQGAKAKLRWTGSWNEVFVALDPAGAEEVPRELADEVLVYLDRYRRVGHDVRVGSPAYVGLDVGLSVCVLPHFQRAHVEAALLDVLSDRVLADGAKGIFHPDNLTFGDGVYASRIIAAAQAVQGVQNCMLTRLKRYVPGEPAPNGVARARDVPMGGKLSLGPFEIARLNDDPTFPENGRLTLQMGGGR